MDLRFFLKLDNKLKIWNDLNKFVLTPSLKEINEKSDLSIKYEFVKKGRSIDLIKFLIK